MRHLDHIFLFTFTMAILEKKAILLKRGAKSHKKGFLSVFFYLSLFFYLKNYCDCSGFLFDFLKP